MWTGFSKARFHLGKWREGKAASINPKTVVKDVLSETEISAGYFLALSIANLIALCGLLTNSLAVIIGAMLISPLMGPILSTGFAFVTGNETIGRQALRKIAFSIFLTLVVAAIATLLSPLKSPTVEILARTRPNFYDLVIALLVGAVGAAAICTKKNYLTVVPGVAIATAVIPPLSVAGYGLGVGSLRIFGGGFLLFFSNFVAIIISTGVVFFIYGFSPGTETEEDVQSLKKRMAVILAILFVIAIPLIYTVHKTISEVTLRTSVQNALRDNFDKTDVSHLAGFDYSKPGDKVFEIHATINTVRYLSEERVSEISNSVGKALSREVKLSVEQILVQKGGLREKVELGPAMALVAVAPKSPSELIREARTETVGIVRNAVVRMNRILVPWEIRDFSAGFSGNSPAIAVNLKIARDVPLYPEETHLLEGVLADFLTLPADLTVEYLPVVPVLFFEDLQAGLSEPMKESLLKIKALNDKSQALRFEVESNPGESRRSRKNTALVNERAKAVVGVLTKDYGIPGDRVKRIVPAKKAKGAPFVKITVLPATDRP
ncbi:MAG: TIGR00341 family protein [Deltaproteobacteria bacterium]|nr:TIGR00341 family protein [Deltaproteobacteria bacterium]